MSAAEPSLAGGLSQVVDAYFHSDHGCLGFSELLLHYNMISEDCADFCAPYQVHEQDLTSSTILQSMDTRPDPLGVCIHRSSFIDAPICVNRSRSPTSQKKNAVDNSEKDTDLGQTIPCSADSVQGNVLHIAGSIIGGSTSTIRPDADSNSPLSPIPTSH